MDNTLEPTEHASVVREYRAYERKQKKRQAHAVREVKKQEEPDSWRGEHMTDLKINEKEWKKDIKMSYAHRDDEDAGDSSANIERVL